MNFIALTQQCHNVSTAVAFLQQRGVIHGERRCEEGHEMTLQLTDSKQRWRCSKRSCRTSYSVRCGTWLDHSKLPFQTIIYFIYCWSRELTSIQFCGKELGMSPATVVDWNNYLREICAWRLLQEPTVIGGNGCVVEIDESLFSRRKHNCGRVLPQQWVFGGICRETKESFLYVVPDRSAATLLPIICAAIRPGTTVMSDEWRSYRNVPIHGYDHRTVNHRYNFVNPDDGTHTQTIESHWRNAKLRNKKQFGTHRGMLDSYLCEFMYRQRYRNRDIFDQVLSDITAFMPPN